MINSKTEQKAYFTAAMQNEIIEGDVVLLEAVAAGDTSDVNEEASYLELSFND